jgi:electron-transferring-flavoprotein dehydrogenase
MEETREVMEFDVLFIGAGVASLSGAYHLAKLIQAHNEKAEKEGNGKKLEDITIAIIEKGAYVGAHSISGAIMDPTPLKELIPDYEEKGAPLEGEVTKEKVSFLTENSVLNSPIIPPPLNNHGNYVISYASFVAWLGEQVEELGIDIFPGFSAVEILYEADRVVGVRLGDKGIGPDGEKKPNYEPGLDLKAKVTVFGEGSRGSLAKQLIKRFRLDEGKNPSNYVVGVKEVWELPEERIAPGEVIHTMGFPYGNKPYGGGFIYGMKNNQVSIGLMTGLDYEDPRLDPHMEFQRFKTHPFIKKLLEGGKLIQYGAKTAPVGGYFSIPKLAVNGALLIGDSANLFISQKIKGVHVAMRSGMLAAETILNCLLSGDFSESALLQYEDALYKSDVGKDLYKSRNFHQAFKKGLWWGLVKSGLQFVLGGRILKSRLESEPDHVSLKKISEVQEKPLEEVKFDGKLTFDKITDVYYSGTVHEEQQPAHLKIRDYNICHERCTVEYGNPCVRFCPASVYEIEEDEATGKKELKLNFSNCLHCKTCDVKDPYENITWTPPEGGGGPKYTRV